MLPNIHTHIHKFKMYVFYCETWQWWHFYVATWREQQQKPPSDKHVKVKLKVMYSQDANSWARNEKERTGEKKTMKLCLSRNWWENVRRRRRSECESENANSVQISIVENWFENHLQCKLTFQLSIETLRVTDRISKSRGRPSNLFDLTIFHIGNEYTLLCDGPNQRQPIE